MLRLLIQHGFVCQWDEKNCHMHYIPIPNDILPENRIYIEITNLFPNGFHKVIGADFHAPNCPIEFITLREFKNEVTYFPVEIFEVYESLLTRNIFGFIKPEVLKMLRDPNCKLRLLIWFPTEGYHLKNMKTIDMLRDSINLLVIPREKVYFVYGDVYAHKNVHSKILDNINFVGFNYFEHAVIQSFSDDPVLEEITENEFVDSFYQPKEKFFLYKNRVSRDHRLFAYSMTMARNLLQYSYYSYLDIFNQVKDSGWWQLEDFLKNRPDLLEHIKNKLGDTFLNAVPKLLDGTIEEVVNTQWSTTKKYQLDTHFSFVSETVTESGLMFVTEKTYKCIWNYHPFIIYGPPGILAYLKSLGYKTFDFIFDESYDNEHDPIKRLIMILDTIEHVCNGYKNTELQSEQLKEILIYNHNHMKSRKHVEHQRLYRILTTHNQ